MSIRLLQNKKDKFWIQQSKTLFGKTYWVTLRSYKYFWKNVLFYIIWNLTFPFILYGIVSIFSSLEEGFIAASLELLSGSYLYWTILWSFVFPYMNARVKEYCDFTYVDVLTIKYDKKVINIQTSDLIKSGKRNIFGKVKDVYYMDNKDLRKQKLEKLKSIFN